MYRRNPTRIEMKLDDMHEYDQKKEEMEERKDPNAWLRSAASASTSVSGLITERGNKSAREERIGLNREQLHQFISRSRETGNTASGSGTTTTTTTTAATGTTTTVASSSSGCGH